MQKPTIACFGSWIKTLPKVEKLWTDQVLLVLDLRLINNVARDFFKPVTRQRNNKVITELYQCSK